MSALYNLLAFALRGVGYVRDKYGTEGIRTACIYILKRVFIPKKNPELIPWSKNTIDNKTNNPIATIIVPTRDKVDILRNCVDSIFEFTRAETFKLIVVDNGSTESATLEYLQGLSALTNVFVIRIDQPFNFSQLNNIAVENVTTEVVCLLNNDTQISQSDWLEVLSDIALDPRVGAVGPTLIYANGVIQHAGISVGAPGIARNYLAGVALNSKVALKWMEQARVVDGVTGACLVIETSKYRRSGGLDESFPVGFNDVDFCLRLKRLELVNIYCPQVQVTHLESQTRGSDYFRNINQAIDDVFLMIKKWSL